MKASLHYYRHYHQNIKHHAREGWPVTIYEGTNTQKPVTMIYKIYKKWCIMRNLLILFTPLLAIINILFYSPNIFVSQSVFMSSNMLQHNSILPVAWLQGYTKQNNSQWTASNIMYSHLLMLGIHNSLLSLFLQSLSVMYEDRQWQIQESIYFNFTFTTKNVGTWI
jgi:hypothetical protein